MDTEREELLERRRDELRRIVYGTREGAPDAAVAELAVVERELAARDGTGYGAAAASVASEESVASAAPVREAADPRMPAGRRTLIIAIAVMVLVGAGFALTGPLRDTVSPPHGLEVFERSPSPGEQVRADDVAASAGLESEVASSLRSVGRVLGHDFWVFHDELQVCLLSRRDFWFDWVADCATLEAFDKSELKRRISADDIRYGARPPRIGPDEMVVVTWGPESITVDWELEPAPPEGSDPMTYEEWSSARLAARPGEP